MDGGTWTVTGSMNTGRFLHSATLLPNGMVLVTGGLDNSFHAIASAELYDPTSGAWTTTGSLNTARYEHGDVWRMGRCSSRVAVIAAAMLPPAPAVRPGPREPRRHRQPRHQRLARGNFTALRKTLVAAGPISFNACATAELSGPASGTSTATGDLDTARNLARRHCCPMGSYSSQQERFAVKVLLKRGTVTRQTGHGRSPVISTRRVWASGGLATQRDRAGCRRGR